MDQTRCYRRSARPSASSARWATPASIPQEGQGISPESTLHDGRLCQHIHRWRATINCNAGTVRPRLPREPRPNEAEGVALDGAQYPAKAAARRILWDKGFQMNILIRLERRRDQLDGRLRRPRTSTRRTNVLFYGRDDPAATQAAARWHTCHGHPTLANATAQSTRKRPNIMGSFRRRRRCRWDPMPGVKQDRVGYLTSGQLR